jgi:uncharacterized protein YoxC
VTANADGVQAQIAAVDAIGSAVQTFAGRARASSDQARSLARAFEREAGEEHARRYEELKDARARRDAAAQVLRACTENCGGLERALAEAESAVQVATRRADASARAVAQIGEAIHGFSRAHGTFTTALDNHVSRATGSTSQLSSQLQQYLGSMGEGNRPGSHERSSVPPGSSSNSRGSVANVALSQIDDDRSEALTFDKVPRDQVVSGLDRLKSVVEPAVAMGKGSEYFSSRDTSAGLSGDQSYSGVHRWFYDSDHAIKLTRTESGRYAVTNGYHRLAVARAMGIDSLPAIVR